MPRLGKFRALRRSRLAFPLGRWRGAALLRRTVTDEGSPLKAGLTAARNFANFVAFGEAASAPSEEGAVKPFSF